jgi:hypothetical protein
MVSGADITDDSPEYHLGSFREKEAKDVMTNTKGVADDSPELMNCIDALKKMKVDLETYSANGGYDLS